MYPCSEDDGMGIFVKNFHDQFNNLGIKFSVINVIKGRQKFKIIKLIRYIIFYITCFLRGLFFNFDLIYIHNLSHCIIPVYFLSFLIKKPIFINVHGTDVKGRSTLNKISTYLFKAMLRKNQIAGIICPSETLKAEISKEYRIDPKFLIVSPSGGVNLDFYNPKAHHDSTQVIPKDKFIIGYYGRLDFLKGLNVFLETLSVLKKFHPFLDTHGVILTLNQPQLNLLNMIKKLDIDQSITIHTYTSRLEIPAWISQFNLFVFPTLLDESLGLVGLEAMACGIPVVGSRTGALPEYILDGYNGYLFDKGNSDDLASKIVKYYESEEWVKKSMRIKALETASKYSAAQVPKLLLKNLSNIPMNQETKQ